jgi:hypothetical protein
VDDLGAELVGDLDGAVDRAGVDDHDLVDGGGHGGQAAREHLLLVADDHAEAEGHAGRGLGAQGGALGAGDQRRNGGVKGAGGAAGGAATVLELGQVLLDVGERGLQALRRLEQGTRTVEAPELVERDAGVAEDDRLCGLLVERVEPGLGDVGEQLGGLRCRGRLAGSGQALLEQQHPRVVARVGVFLLAGAGE